MSKVMYPDLEIGAEELTNPKAFLRTPYNYDMDMISDETGLKCEDVSRAKQSFKEECDINTIIDRFGIGYEMPTGVKAPVYGDFTEVCDFRSAMDAVLEAQKSFMALPAEVRSRFGNDPNGFVEFCSKDENYDEVEKLGLLHSGAAQRRKAERDAAEAARIEALVAARVKADKPS